MPNTCRVAIVTTVPMSLDFYRGQVASLREQGFEVVAVSAPGPELDAFAASTGVDVYPVPMTRQITPLRDLASLARLTWTLARLRPDVVQASTPKGGLLGMTAARLTFRPVCIFNLWGLPHQTKTGIRRALLARTAQLACRLSDHVVCVGESVRQEAVRTGLCPDEKTSVLANGTVDGVDALSQFNPTRLGATPKASGREYFGLPEDVPVVGFVGRLARDKGIEDLAAAWVQLREVVPAAHLLMVGPDEPDDPASVESLATLKSDPRVIFTGRIPDPAVAMAAMDVFVLPTYREGFGTVLIEASAMGLPVVGTQVTGVVDAVVPGVTGKLVPAHAPTELADAIRAYLESPELRAQHGKAGRDRAIRDFSPEGVRAAVITLYHRLLSAKGRSAPQPLAVSSVQP